MVLTKCPIQNGTELWTPGDEYNKFWREGSPKLLKKKKLTEQFGTPLPRGRLGRTWRVYLATGFDFRGKNRACFGSIGVPTLASVSYLVTIL